MLFWLETLQAASEAVGTNSDNNLERTCYDSPPRKVEKVNDAFLLGDLFSKLAAWMINWKNTPLFLKVKKISMETSCSHLLNVRLHPCPGRILTSFSP